LGRSLGVDLLSTEGRTYSLDCIYCQLGRTIHRTDERKEFVSTARVRKELEAVPGLQVDYVTFSGVGEPTFATNLGEAIILAKSILKLPVVVLPNSSLMTREDVRNELRLADVVVAKLDAPSENVFNQVNCPCYRCRLHEVIRAIKIFRNRYLGKLAIQMMFVEANKYCVADMVRISRQLVSDEIQLNTPLHPSSVHTLISKEMNRIESSFIGSRRVLNVYEASRPQVIPLDSKEIQRRRPL